MQRHLLMKVFAIALLALLLLVPLWMIEAKIEERASYRNEVQSEVAETYAGAQRVNGPVLVIPYVETTRTLTRTEHRGEGTVSVQRVDRTLLVFPQELAVTGDVQVQARKRGIHETQVWRARELQFSGRFVLPALPTPATPLAGVTLTVELGEPYVAFGVSDLRGFVATPAIELDGTSVAFEPRSAPPFEGAAVRAPVAAALMVAGAVISFRLIADLAGTRELSIVPLGDQTRVSLTSNWPHPSFGGRFLPIERAVGDAGFSAQWSIPAIATNARAAFGGEAATGQSMGRAARPGAQQTSATAPDALGVRLIQPIDIYAMAARATKYGALFVFLTFGAFWIFEALRQIVIHPVQYGFVGAALAIFFLLLLALSEHLPFAVSYAIAAGACIVLITVYLAAVLAAKGTASAFGGGLAGLYASLYAVIRLEDTALLIGALLLFAALACAMLVSRRVDWSGFGLPRRTAAASMSGGSPGAS